MNRRKLLSLLGMSPVLLANASAKADPLPKNAKAETDTGSTGGKVTAVNPKGTPPAIKLIPMAPRLDSLDGKTVYSRGYGFPRLRYAARADADLVQGKHARRQNRLPEKSGAVRARRSCAVERDQGKRQRGNYGRWALKHLRPSDRRSLHNNGKDGNSERSGNHEGI